MRKLWMLPFVAAMLVSACERSGEALSVTSATGSPGASGGSSGDPAAVTPIRILSNRSDMISGGDALVEIVGGNGGTRVELNGKDVSSSFGRADDGRWYGLIEGLELGVNTISAGGYSAQVLNYPNEGPIFSGPRIDRLHCQDGAVDKYCNQPAVYTYLYKSTDPQKYELQPYDPANPPGDVADATTDNGTTLPFIVRLETGYQDRDQYKIFTLFDPAKGWSARSPQPQWNHKVLVTHGGNCGADYTPGNAPTDDYSGTIPANPGFEQSYIYALRKGFMVMSTALGNTGHNCDIAYGAEAMMMAKERLVEQYGLIRYTIGTGCSGGSIAQATIANSYPGIYQGLLTMCSYPDTFSAGLQFTDLHLMRGYFEDPSKWGAGVAWSPTQWGPIEGHLTHANAISSDELLYKAATDPTGANKDGPCYGPNTYDPSTNPGGVRCSIIDWMPEIFGTRTPDVWSPMEHASGEGFTGLPLGNNGVQYGLLQLQGGQISAAQFVDLNVKIGGLDVDIKPQAARSKADHPAVENAYRSGTINMANNLNTVAIINFLGPDPGAAHDSVHAFWTRRRITREHGNHDNHVMWAGPAALIGDPNYVYDGIDAMDLWLGEIEKDLSGDSLAQKIVKNKPASVGDKCVDNSGAETADASCVDAAEAAYAYSTPRVQAGDSNTADNLDCYLKPIDPLEYGVLGLTADQIAQLEAVFPEGVCDWSKGSVGKQPTIPWLSYQDTSGKMIVGGTKIGAIPTASRGGWNSPAWVYP